MKLLFRFGLVENLDGLTFPQLQKHLLEVPSSDKRGEDYINYICNKNVCVFI